MKQYKGKYIDGAIFHNEVEVDQFLLEQAIQGYKVAVEVFCARPSMASSLYADERADKLVNQFGLDWEEVEVLEARFMSEYSASLV